MGLLSVQTKPARSDAPTQSEASTFGGLMSSGNYQGAANYGKSLGYNNDQIASYVGSNNFGVTKDQALTYLGTNSGGQQTGASYSKPTNPQYNAPNDNSSGNGYFNSPTNPAPSANITPMSVQPANRPTIPKVAGNTYQDYQNIVNFANQNAQRPTDRVVQSNETSAGQLDQMTRQDSPLMQQAQQRGLLTAAGRGMQNSSMAAGASQASMVNAAQPFALQDANTYATAAANNKTARDNFQQIAYENGLKTAGQSLLNNQQAQNNLLNTGLQGDYNLSNTELQGRTQLANTDLSGQYQLANADKQGYYQLANTDKQGGYQLANTGLQGDYQLRNTDKQGGYQLANTGLQNQGQLNNTQLQNEGNLAGIDLTGKYKLADTTLVGKNQQDAIITEYQKKGDLSKQLSDQDLRNALAISSDKTTQDMIVGEFKAKLDRATAHEAAYDKYLYDNKLQDSNNNFLAWKDTQDNSTNIELANIKSRSDLQNTITQGEYSYKNVSKQVEGQIITTGMNNQTDLTTTGMNNQTSRDNTRDTVQGNITTTGMNNQTDLTTTGMNNQTSRDTTNATVQGNITTTGMNNQTDLTTTGMNNQTSRDNTNATVQGNITTTGMNNQTDLATTGMNNATTIKQTQIQGDNQVNNTNAQGKWNEIIQNLQNSGNYDVAKLNNDTELMKSNNTTSQQRATVMSDLTQAIAARIQDIGGSQNYKDDTARRDQTLGAITGMVQMYNYLARQNKTPELQRSEWDFMGIKDPATLSKSVTSTPTAAALS